MNDTVTIGLPFKNNEKTLELAIKSILLQTHKNWKLILINDGSDDNSLSIAERYAQDERITIINDGENKGLPYRLNQIVNLCATNFLARMDADDIMFPNRIEKQFKYMVDNSKFDVVGSEVVVIDEKNRIKGLRKSYPQKSINYHLHRNSFFIHPTVFGKTSWFRKNKYDTKLKRSQDFDLWVRTYKNSNFGLLNEPLLFYRDLNNFNFKRYKENHKFRRIIIKNIRKNKEISFFNFLFAISFSFIKVFIYFFINITGFYKIISSKNRNIANSKSMNDYKKVMDEILSQNIQKRL